MAEEITISTEELTKLVETFKNMGDPIAQNTAELIKLAKAAKAQNKIGEEMVSHVVNANLRMKQFGQNADKLSKSIRDTTEAYKRGELSQKDLEKSVADLRHEIDHTSDKARRAALMMEKASLEEANLRAMAGKEFSDGLGRITTQVGASMMKNIMTAATGLLSGQDAMTAGTQMMKGNIDNLNTGAQAGAKGLQSLGAATAGAGGKVGLFGIAVSGAGAALSMFANAATELTKQGLSFMLTQSQQMVSGFQQMSQVGAIYAGGLTQMTSTALAAGMTIDQFSKSIVENKESLGKLGIGATEATKRLSKAMGAGGEEARRGMFALGMTMDEQATAYADTMARMAGSTGKLHASDKEIAEQTQIYARDLKLISDLTGKAARQQQDDAKVRTSTASMQIALSKMTETQRDEIKKGMGMMDAASAKALQQRIASKGNAISDPVTAQLENYSPALKAYHEQQYALVAAGKYTAEEDMKLRAEYSATIRAELGAQEDLVNAQELGGKNIEGVVTAIGSTMEEFGKTSGADIEQKKKDLKAAQDLATAKGKDGKYTDTGAAALMEANQDMATSMQKLANDNLPKFSEALLDTIKNMKEGIAKAVASIGVEKGVMAGALGQLSGLIGIVGGIASTVLPLIMMKGMMKGAGPAAGALGGMAPGSMSGWKAGATAGGRAGPGSVLGGGPQAASGMSKVGGGMASLGEGAAKLGAGLGKGGGALIEGILTGIAGGLKAFAAPQVAIGAAAFSAAIAIIGAGIAGAAWLLGKALPTLAEGLGKFNDINGKNLIDVGLGAAALGAGLAVFAAGGVAAGVGAIIGNLTDGLINFFDGKTPLDKLVEFSKLDIDPDKTKLNAEAFVAFGNAMAAFTGSEPGLFATIGAGIASFFTSEPPFAKLLEFSKLDIDPDKTKLNAEAFVAFGNAMAASTGSAPGLFATIGAGIASFFTSKPPIAELLEFSKLDFDAKKVKENGDAVAAFGLAMAALRDVKTQPGVFATVGDSIGKFFGAKMPYDKLEEFGKLNLDVKKIKDNAEAFKAFAEAMGQWQGVGGARVAGSVSSRPTTAPGGPQGGAGSGQAPAPTSSKPPEKVEPTAPPGKPTIPGAITPGPTTPLPGGTAGLLEQIARGEGTDDASAKKHGLKSGYDVSLAYGKYGKKDKDLSDMTFAEVKAYQKSMLADPNNKMRSSAVGKYQFITSTLAEQQKKGGYKDTDKFDAAAQEKMGAQLLKQRGLDQYTSGKITKDQLQQNLSQEWASIAAAKDHVDKNGVLHKAGESYYGQHAGTTDSQIKKAISGLDGSTTEVPAAVGKATESSKVATDLTKTFAEKTQAEQDAMRMGRGRKGADAGPTTTEKANAADTDSLTKRYGKTVSVAEPTLDSGPSVVNAQLEAYRQNMMANVQNSVRGMENYRVPQYNNQNDYYNTVAQNRGVMPVQMAGEMGADGKRGKDPLSMGFGNLQQIMSKVADFQEMSVSHQQSLVGLADENRGIAQRSLRAIE